MAIISPKRSKSHITILNTIHSDDNKDRITTKTFDQKEQREWK